MLATLQVDLQSYLQYTPVMIKLYLGLLPLLPLRDIGSVFVSLSACISFAIFSHGVDSKHSCVVVAAMDANGDAQQKIKSADTVNVFFILSSLALSGSYPGCYLPFWHNNAVSGASGHRPYFRLVY